MAPITKGFSLTNNTGFDAYLQDPLSSSEYLANGATSGTQTALGIYSVVGSQSFQPANVYFTITVAPGNFEVLPGKKSPGKFTAKIDVV